MKKQNQEKLVAWLSGDVDEERLAQWAAGELSDEELTLQEALKLQQIVQLTVNRKLLVAEGAMRFADHGTIQ